MDEVQIVSAPPTPPPLIPMASPSSYKMGFFGATSYVIGNIIGCGIFISPATILRYTDSVCLSLLVWVAGALIAFLGEVE